MPYTTRFVESGKGVIRTASGVLHASEMIDASRELAGSDALVKLEFLLVDLTSVTEGHMTSEDIREMARVHLEMAVLRPGLLVAVVAPQDHLFGLARMWQVRAEPTGWKTHVTRSRADAEAWLASQRRGFPM